jgi:hypothetical protein
MYVWTWTGGASVVYPPNSNIAVAFSGWNVLANAISESAAISSYLKGQIKFISIGGGDATTGSFTVAVLNSLNNAITSGQLSAYNGICYDIEVGDSGLATSFANSFSLAKSKGFKVLVTVSHSAPYAIPDAATLMASFFPNTDIDILSPQLYSSGYETANDFTANWAVAWTSWTAAKAAVVPSIVSYTFYSTAVSFFATYNIATQGYIQWKQN